MTGRMTRRCLLRQTGSAAIAATGMVAAANTTSATNNGARYPMFQYDTANTGYNPNVSGPTESVQQKWTFNGGEPIRSTPAVLDNTVYFGHSSGMTFAVNAETGDQQWQTQTGAVETGVAVSGDRVYLTGVSEGDTKSFHLRSLFASNGTEIWEVPLGNEQIIAPGHQFTDLSPVITQNFILVGGATAQQVNTERGDTRWERGTFNFDNIGGRGYYDEDDSYFVAGNAGFRGKRAYLHFDGFDDGETRYSGLTATNLASGKNKWMVSTFTRVPLTVADSMVWGATNDLLYALSESDGTKQWEFRTGPVVASPAVANGTVYVGSEDSKFYALSVSTGELEWLVPTDAPVRSAPVVADGVVYFGTDGGTVYAINTEDGAEMWKFSTGGRIRSSPAVVDGTLFIGSEDKNLYALTE